MRLVRYAAAVYLIGSGIGNVFLAFERRWQLSSARFAAELAQIPANTIACVIALWRPRLGALLGLITLVLTLVQGPTGNDSFFVLIVTPVMLAATASSRTVVVFAGLHVAYAFVRAWGRPQPIAILAWYVGLVVCAYAMGLLVRWLLRAERRGRRGVGRLQRAASRVGADERALLASELQVVVIDSLAGLRDAVTVARERPGTGAAAEAWGSFATLSQAALAEMRRLVGMLRDPTEPAAVTDPGGAVVRTRHVRGFVAVVVGVAAYLNLSLVLAEVSSGRASPVDVVVTAACYAGALLVLWWPMAGLGVAGSAMVAAVLTGNDSLGPIALLVTVPVSLALHPRWRARILPVALAGLGLALGVALRRPSTDGLIALFGAALGGLALGLASRYFLEGREHVTSELARLEAAKRDAQEAERRRLARELHDVVAHQLSIVALEVMAHGDSSDPVEVASALDVVDRSVAAAQTDLDLLVRVLTNGEQGAASPDAGLLVPTAVAAALEATLREQGHPISVEVPAPADALDPSVRRTLVRTMQEAATNILRYGRPGGMSALVVTVTGEFATLTVTSPLPPTPRTSALSSGLGLRGIRERAALTGGTLAAGPHGDDWVVAISVPLT